MCILFGKGTIVVFLFFLGREGGGSWAVSKFLFLYFLLQLFVQKTMSGNNDKWFRSVQNNDPDAECQMDLI